MPVTEQDIKTKQQEIMQKNLEAYQAQITAQQKRNAVNVAQLELQALQAQKQLEDSQDNG